MNKEFKGINEEDVITILEMAHVALKDKYIAEELGHQLDLRDEELNRISGKLKVIMNPVEKADE